MLSPDEITRKVAEKHRIVIAPDDPVLAFVALNDIYIGEYSSTINQGLREESERLTVQIQTLLKQQTAFARQQIQKEFAQANDSITKAANLSFDKLYQALSDHIKVVADIKNDTIVLKKSAWVAVGVAVCINLLGFAAILLFFYFQ